MQAVLQHIQEHGGPPSIFDPNATDKLRRIPVSAASMKEYYELLDELRRQNLTRSGGHPNMPPHEDAGARMPHLYTADPNNSGPEIPGRLSEDRAQQAELGNQCDGPAHVTDKDKELRRKSGVEVAVDQPRQITPSSASPVTFFPHVETSSRKRKFRLESPPSEASQPVAKLGPVASDEDLDGEKIAPTTKKRRPKVKAKEAGG